MPFDRELANQAYHFIEVNKMITDLFIEANNMIIDHFIKANKMVSVGTHPTFVYAKIFCLSVCLSVNKFK